MNAPTRGHRPWHPAFLGVAAAYMIFLTIDQSHWWRLKPDYSFGWLVPLFVGYVVHERWGRLRDCARAGGASPLSAGRSLALTVAAAAALGLGLAVFAMGALYRAGSGPTQPGSAAMAAGFALLLPALTCLSLPPGGVALPGPGGLRRRDARLHAVGLMLFPALVWLVSAPLVSAVENAISVYLLRKVVAVVFFVFDSAGYSLVREGSVLLLPKGQVGVADACSGIRSLTGCLFAGSFLAAIYLDRLWKKILLVVLAMGFAFLTNLLRSLFLTGWAYAFGSAAIEGPLHDATGYAVLGLTSVGLFLILPLFRRANWARWLGLEPAVTSPLNP
jgi:exosortase/archaeosortase family protein